MPEVKVRCHAGPGIAERQLGSVQPGTSNRGWYSRGYLPHCDHPGVLQAITYRLADSLPVDVFERMDVEPDSLRSRRSQRRYN